ncbi:MAG: hypothetical protein D6814_05265 [Calditrichaeota bacterium]|nr:MAG: hypothetical protein D6814_05265 [Calditrichota bacterium]
MTNTTKAYKIGDEIFTYCTKCKTDMYHVITAMKDDVIKKVMCKGCNTTHVFKQESVKADNPKPKPEKPKKTIRRRRKKDWESLQADISEDDIRDYQLDQDYSQTVAIRHSRFGIGVIYKVLSNQQIEVIFKEGTKILVQNFKGQ